MKKLALFLFFTALATFFVTASLRAQKLRSHEWSDSLKNGLLQLDSNLFALKHGDWDNGHHFDSLAEKLKGLNHLNRHNPEYYYRNNGQRYYIDIIPPAQKGKRVDHSKIWLLKDEVAQSCP